jgi:hypothetical protein
MVSSFRALSRPISHDLRRGGGPDLVIPPSRPSDLRACGRASSGARCQWHYDQSSGTIAPRNDISIRFDRPSVSPSTRSIRWMWTRACSAMVAEARDLRAHVRESPRVRIRFGIFGWNSSGSTRRAVALTREYSQHRQRLVRSRSFSEKAPRRHGRPWLPRECKSCDFRKRTLMLSSKLCRALRLNGFREALNRLAELIGPECGALPTPSGPWLVVKI